MLTSLPGCHSRQDEIETLTCLSQTAGGMVRFPDKDLPTEKFIENTSFPK